jgi:ABC-type antimicrobial peptide transport system permease subunit
MLIEAALFGFVGGLVFAGVVIGVCLLIARWQERKERTLPFSDPTIQWKKRDGK